MSNNIRLPDQLRKDIEERVHLGPKACEAHKALWLQYSLFAVLGIVLAYLFTVQPVSGLFYVVGGLGFCVCCMRSLVYQEAAKEALKRGIADPTKSN